MPGAPVKFPWKAYWLVLLVIMLFAMLPVFVIAIVNMVNDAPVHMPEIMASMGVFGWLLLAPFTIGGMAVFIWLVVLFLHLLFRRLRRGGAVR